MQTKKQVTEENTVLSDEEMINRMRALKRWKRVRIIFMISTIIGPFAVFAVFGANEMIMAGFASAAVCFVLSYVLAIIAGKQDKKLKDIIGTNMVLPVLRESFEVKEYSKNKHLPAQLVKDASLVIDWTDINGSDYIEGSYKGIPILYSDLHLQRKEIERDEDGYKVEYDTVFKGQWLVCDFHKELSATVRLIEGSGKGNIETENIEFNKKYQIYTKDGHTAFYLLTPHFMERLMAVDEAADASTRFCFQGGKVHIAVTTGRDSFELGRTKLDNADNVRQKFRSDLKYMTDIMDILLTHEKLFKEEE